VGGVYPMRKRDIWRDIIQELGEEERKILTGAKISNWNDKRRNLRGISKRKNYYIMEKD